MSATRRLLLARAALTPDTTAFVNARTGASTTWAQLARFTAEMTSRRAEFGEPRPGTMVGLVAEDPLRFVAAYLALLSQGATVLPLDPRGGADEVASRLAELGAVTVMTDCGAGAEAARRAAVHALWTLDGLRPRRIGPLPRWSTAYSTPPGVVLCTSGTTGAPKGVVLPERKLLGAAARVSSHHRIERHDRGFSPLPLFHVNAQVTGVLGTLQTGASLVLDDRFHRRDYWDVVDRFRPTWLNAVPAILAVLASDGRPVREPGHDVRFVRSASAPLPDATRDAFELRFGIGILETYGMTEAAGQITANPLDPRSRRAGSVGLPVGIRLRVVGSDGAPVPAGVTGDVEIRGPDIASEHLLPGTPPRRSPIALHEGWLRTGDVGMRDREGFVFLAGRSDDVINRGGEKVYPREIEEVLQRHPAVASAAVVGEPDEVLGERPVAFVVVHDGESRADVIDELAAVCRERLTRPKRPDRFEIIDRFPVGATGKVRRPELRDRLRRDAAAVAT